MAVHEKLGRFDVELFGHVFAYFHQVSAALSALTGFGLVTMFDARQVRRQRLPAGARARRFSWNTLAGRHLAQLLDFRDNRREVFADGVFEQVVLQQGERFVFSAITHPAQMRQFQDQRLDFQFLGMEFGVQLGVLLFSLRLRLLLDLLEQRLNLPSATCCLATSSRFK